MFYGNCEHTARSGERLGKLWHKVVNHCSLPPAIGKKLGHQMKLARNRFKTNRKQQVFVYQAAEELLLCCWVPQACLHSEVTVRILRAKYSSRAIKQQETTSGSGSLQTPDCCSWGAKFHGWEVPVPPPGICYGALQKTAPGAAGVTLQGRLGCTPTPEQLPWQPMGEGAWSTWGIMVSSLA